MQNTTPATNPMAAVAFQCAPAQTLLYAALTSADMAARELNSGHERLLELITVAQNRLKESKQGICSCLAGYAAGSLASGALQGPVGLQSGYGPCQKL